MTIGVDKSANACFFEIRLLFVFSVLLILNALYDGTNADKRFENNSAQVMFSKMNTFFIALNKERSDNESRKLFNAIKINMNCLLWIINLRKLLLVDDDSFYL